MAQLAEHLPSRVWFLAPQKLDTAACTWAVEAGGPETQGHPQLFNKFKANLSYMKPCLNNNKPRKKQKANMNCIVTPKESSNWLYTKSFTLCLRQ